MYSPDYDPEGLLSTLTTSAVTVCAGIPPSTHISTGVNMIGTLISKYILPLHHKTCISPESSTRRSRITFYVSLLLLSLLLIHPLPSLFQIFLPLSKPLWTPPFLLQTIGVTLLSWLLASLIDIYPSLPVPGVRLLETMGRRSLEVYLAAEILQEFVMYPGKRRGGGVWEDLVRGICTLGVERRWSCLAVSLGWGVVFAGFGWGLDVMGWRLRL